MPELPKVLLLITDAGGGHRGSAQSLQAHAKALGAPLDLRIVNVYREIWQEAEPLGRMTGVYGEDLYNFVLKKSWLVLAHLAAKAPNPKAHRDGVAFLKQEKPALCVSLMPFVNDIHVRMCREARLELGLDPDALTVLVSMGGYGGKTMEDLIAGLEHVGKDWQLVAICGRNEALRAADLMVGKPGSTRVRF